MTNIAIGNNGPSNNPYIRIVPRSGFGSGDATITIAGPLTVPGRTGLQYEPDLNIEAKSIVFPTPFVADVGARAYLRMISQSSIIWGVNSQITLHRDYARFQLATPSQSWSTLPKVVIDGSSSDPNAAPAFIWGAPERLPAATRLNIDSATPSGSEIVETWFFIHNGQLRFSNTSPNQIGPFNRLFMYPNTEFVQEGSSRKKSKSQFTCLQKVVVCFAICRNSNLRQNGSNSSSIPRYQSQHASRASLGESQHHNRHRRYPAYNIPVPRFTCSW